jgi:hypothetical protein
MDIQPAEHVEIVADFGSIPLPYGICSHIYLGDVIEHVPVWRLDEVLREWNRITILGGVIAGRTPNPDRCLREFAAGKMTLSDFLGAIYGKGDRPEQVHYMTYSSEGLTTLFAQYGFEVTDFSGSPGPAERPWWWVFSGTKVRDL